MLKVHYDDQVFTWQPRGGISRYFVELLKAFAAPGFGVEASTSASWSQNRHLLEMGRGRTLPGVPGRRKEVLQLANRLQHPRPLGHSIVHHTYYDRRYLRRAAKFRVVTVYDMIPELFPELFPRGNPHQDKREFVAAADLVLCISEATKRDLERFYGAVAAPVVVTPLGVDPLFHPRAASSPPPPPYVLFVGDRVGYKDFWVLAEAFAAAALPADVQLRAVGGGPLRSHEIARLQKLCISERVLHERLDDVGLASAYANALVFVFPSRYEGFGLPTLEAMASGCPTILTSESSHPEVGGPAARYFPAGDVAELSRLLEQLVADAHLRRELSALGSERALMFSWSETARRTADAYREHLS